MLVGAHLNYQVAGGSKYDAGERKQEVGSRRQESGIRNQEGSRRKMQHLHTDILLDLLLSSSLALYIHLLLDMFVRLLADTRRN